jgi:hypothetical protein
MASTFEIYLASMLKKRGVKKAEIAQLLDMNPSNVTRRFGQKPQFRREEIAKIDAFLGMEGTLLEKAGYSTKFDSFAGYVQESESKKYTEVPIGHWSWLLRGESLQSALFDKQLEKIYRTTSSRTLCQEMKPLVGLARLIQAHGLMNSLPTTRLYEPVNLAKTVLQLYPDEETTLFGTAIILCASRMRTGQIGDVDMLERLQSTTARSSDYVTSFFYEELARQRILSDSSDHTLDVVKVGLIQGKERCLADPQLKDRLAGFDDILGRAAWMKTGDPRTGATLLHGAVKQLEASGHSLDLLIRAYAYEGVMRLEAGQRQEGEQVLLKGYQLARQIGLRYFVDWLEQVPGKYGFDVKEQIQGKRENK